jgi:hypothetical protein
VAALVAVSLVLVAGCGADERASLRSPTTAPTAPASGGTTQAYDLPETARVSCDGETTAVAVPHVRPQRDGIHVRFENLAGRPLAYSVESPRAGGRGAAVPPEGVEVVVTLPPGALAVACFDPESHEDPSEAERAELEVVDVLGLWTPSVLGSTCKSAVSTHGDYGAGATGEVGAPAEIARAFLEERGVLRPDDTVQAAGYPDQEHAVVRLARAGETVVVVEFASDAEGGRLVSDVTACTGIGLG